MGLFKNRKRSGMVLTGVVLSSGVVSAVNQGVVGAVTQGEVADGVSLRKLVDKGARGLILNCVKVISLVLLAGIIGCIIYIVVACFASSKKEDNNIPKVKELGDKNSNNNFNNNSNSNRKEGNIINNGINDEEKDGKKDGKVISNNNDIPKEKEQNNKDLNNNKIDENNKNENDNKINNNGGNFNNNKVISDNNNIPKEEEQNNKDLNDNKINENNKNENDNNVEINNNNNDINENNKVDGEFGGVFCSNEGLNGKISKETLKKMINLEGCIFNTSMDEISDICGNVFNRSFFERHKGERVNVLICEACESGGLLLNLLDEKDNALLKNVCTKYALNCEKLNCFCDNLSKKGGKAYLKAMPFGRVFCQGSSKIEYCRNAEEKLKEIEKSKGRVYKVSRKEIRAICAASYADDLEKILQDYGVDKEEIKIKIRGACDGRLGLEVLGEENKFLGYILTKYATADAGELGNLVGHLGKNAELGETPFGKVFCYSTPWDELDTVNISSWKELKKFERKTLDIEIKEFRLIVDSVEALDKKISKCKLKGEKIEVEISSVLNGFLGFSVFDENDGGKQLSSFYTKYAVKNNKEIEELVKYLGLKTNNEEKKDNKDNNTGMMSTNAN